MSGRSNADIVRWLAERDQKPRVAMTGRSMLPLLHHPMVLELGGTGLREPTIGDVIVFEGDDGLIAHRIVGAVDGICITSGDAVPWKSERVARSEIIGRVIRVFSHDGPGARRLDGPLFYAYGALLGRSHSLRRYLAAARGLFRRPRSLGSWCSLLPAALHIAWARVRRTDRPTTAGKP